MTPKEIEVALLDVNEGRAHVQANRKSCMPNLDVKALQRIMLERNFLFKHPLANLVGLSYGRLTDIIVNNERVGRPVSRPPPR